MTFKIKVEIDPFEAKGPFLCCTLNNEAECTFCHERMCQECAKAWSPRKHFILDMCRKRFSKEQLDKAMECYKERIAKSNGKSLSGLGNCDVCTERRKLHNYDRYYYDKYSDEEEYDEDYKVRGP